MTNANLLHCILFVTLLGYSSLCSASVPVALNGELRQWHTIELAFAGPEVSEQDPYNPFLNYRLNVEFRHPTTGKSYVVPGFFAADGNAANTAASRGNQWQVRFSPDEVGLWSWQAQFRKGPYVAISEAKHSGRSGAYMDGQGGQFDVQASNKQAPDFRALGRLQWVNERYLRFTGSGDYFIKAGPDSPENLLAYTDFDGSQHQDGFGDELMKTWAPHRADWQKGDPTWADDKGKNLIGALNYIASKGMNSISFLTLNIKGDDKNVFPYVDYHTYDRFDVSKLEQWNIVFSHAQSLGLFLHFKTQEVENQGLLDGGGLGAERKLYYRELIARFGHHLALNWNMGEENGDWVPENTTAPQGTLQRLAMAAYFKQVDPYQHHRVIHNGWYFNDLRGADSWYTGASVQTSSPDFSNVHKQAKEILSWPNANGRQWAVAVDEPGDAEHALKPDAINPEHRDARQNGLWGAYMAGAWGTEWYFGYKHAHSDLTAQDWRSRDKFWQQAKIAIDFFSTVDVPLHKAKNHDDLAEGAWVLAELGEFYIVYVKRMPEKLMLKMLPQNARYSVQWYDPLRGGGLQFGSVKQLQIEDEGKYSWLRVASDLGQPPTHPNQEWAILVKKL
ncbi:DUF5060 domain-containing protein [Neiella sp. HB171785]|uniref:DUF5060 domain-containing protein n=1 Tax=Neiella litorisoli TaxID=2771431 RepID=A0A8J6QTU5_9GAMM|nr:DUF5060 domain-containing protein [Neiella litorisoli]MBD1388273.1 DUF5060 domain-containing protein [Neiella litorisoli]